MRTSLLKQKITGMVFGKFMPLHTGHIKLIEFGAQQVEKLIVLVAYKRDEPIDGQLRYARVKEQFKDRADIIVRYLDCTDMSDSKEADREVSREWASYLNTTFPEVKILFSSEAYGDFVAEYGKLKHIMYDEPRATTPVSATMIRNDPVAYRDYIPKHIQPYFVKKVCIVGTESTWKSTITKRLAEYFATSYVTEAGRDLVPDTFACTMEDLNGVAEEHARRIKTLKEEANKILFMDTDLTITRSYGRFLFYRDLKVAPWVEAENKADLYLYMDKDCPLVQDGGRLEEEGRTALDISHQKTLADSNITVHHLNGSREEKFEKAIALISTHIGKTAVSQTLLLSYIFLVI
jgi:HTH-type transcriptional repressor of NAD biosynthesis genes